MSNISRPSARRDILHSTQQPDEVVSHPRDPKRIPNTPRVFLGSIASANILLKNPIRRDFIRDKYRAKAVEMEGSGVSDASWFQSKDYFIVRGICDYCDKHKGDDWQNYAAVVAAAYMRALLESIDAAGSGSVAEVTSQEQRLFATEAAPFYSLDLYGDHNRILEELQKWRFVSSHASTQLILSGDHIGIGNSLSSTFNLPPVMAMKNCRIECEIKIEEDGGNRTHWAGIRVRGFRYDIGLGYLVYLRSSGTVELYSNGRILKGEGNVLIKNTKDNWTKLDVQIINSEISVSVNNRHHFTASDERFQGKDFVFLHTFGVRSLFRNLKIHPID